jgi:hypothetical protein
MHIMLPPAPACSDLHYAVSPDNIVTIYAFALARILAKVFWTS